MKNNNGQTTTCWWFDGLFAHFPQWPWDGWLLSKHLFLTGWLKPPTSDGSSRPIGFGRTSCLEQLLRKSWKTVLWKLWPPSSNGCLDPWDRTHTTVVSNSLRNAAVSPAVVSWKAARRWRQRNSDSLKIAVSSISSREWRCKHSGCFRKIKLLYWSFPPCLFSYGWSYGQVPTHTHVWPWPY